MVATKPPTRREGTRGAEDKTAAGIEHALLVQVLRGAYPPDSHLPTVRELARRFGVNPSTAQRAVTRLERTGIIDVRQGSGIRVRDPHLVGDLSLLPAWLEALADEPARAASMLADFLEVRRVLAARLIVRHRRRLAKNAARLAAATAAFGEAKGSPEQLQQADLEFSRALLRETGNTVAVTVLNTAARLLEQIPELGLAMYAEPERNLRSTVRVVAALGAEVDDAELGAIIEAALAGIDGTTVRRFEVLLARRRVAPDEEGRAS